jgi:L-threonylcarbamoyladenylate synthase
VSSAERPFPAATGGASVAQFERVIAAGGVAVFPADTVYGLACDPGSAAAVERLYALKHRPPAKPAAVMCFGAAPDLPELGPRTRAALAALTPGGVTLLLANPRHRWPLACGPDPGTLGLRVIGGPLAAMPLPVMQSSANRSGGPDARRLGDVPAAILEAADLVLDGGELPGTPSTVIDLRAFEPEGAWTVVREGAMAADAVATVLR